jgi:hypothetical protein
VRLVRRGSRRSLTRRCPVRRPRRSGRWPAVTRRAAPSSCAAGRRIHGAPCSAGRERACRPRHTQAHGIMRLLGSGAGPVRPPDGCPGLRDGGSRASVRLKTCVPALMVESGQVRGAAGIVGGRPARPEQEACSWQLLVLHSVRKVVPRGRPGLPGGLPGAVARERAGGVVARSRAGSALPAGGSSAGSLRSPAFRSCSVAYAAHCRASVRVIPSAPPPPARRSAVARSAAWHLWPRRLGWRSRIATRSPQSCRATSRTALGAARPPGRRRSRRPEPMWPTSLRRRWEGRALATPSGRACLD